MEIGAQWAIAKKDKDLFERYMAQLKCYYLDYKVDELPGDKWVQSFSDLHFLSMVQIEESQISVVKFSFFIICFMFSTVHYLLCIIIILYYYYYNQKNSIKYFFFNTIFVSSHIYPENPERTQVIVGSINMGYISDTASNRTHNLFRPNREPISLGQSDGLCIMYMCYS